LVHSSAADLKFLQRLQQARLGTSNRKAARAAGAQAVIGREEFIILSIWLTYRRQYARLPSMIGVFAWRCG
jgi:hypothetical protein